MGRRNILFAKPSLDNQEINNVVNCLKSGWLTTGELVFDFERNIGEYIGSKYNIAVSSCTAAIHLCLEMYGIGEGDEVITSPMTFVSTVNTIEHCGAKAVFADIDKYTLNIDPSSIEENITSRTKAIIIVHYSGHPCDMDRINKISEKYNIPIIEDAAHAFGAKYKNIRVGNSNNLVCFSFYATKNITAGEGGMICTNNPKYVNKLKAMRLHGMTMDAWKRYSKEGKPQYDVIEPGYKYNMTDISAAIGIEQLKKSENFLNIRRKLVQEYKRLISEKNVNCEILVNQNYSESSNYIFPILLNNTVSRDEVISKLKYYGINVSILFKPVYEFIYYRKKYKNYQYRCPNCDDVSNRILCLPLHTQLNIDDIDYVVDLLSEIIQGV